MISVNPRAESLNAAHVPTLNSPLDVPHVGPPSLIVMMVTMRTKIRMMMMMRTTTMTMRLSEDVGIPD